MHFVSLQPNHQKEPQLFARNSSALQEAPDEGYRSLWQASYSEALANSEDSVTGETQKSRLDPTILRSMGV